MGGHVAKFDSLQDDAGLRELHMDIQVRRTPDGTHALTCHLVLKMTPPRMDPRS